MFNACRLFNILMQFLREQLKKLFEPEKQDYRNANEK